MSESTSLTTYLDTINQITARLDSAGQPVRDKDKIAVLLNGLSDIYRPIVLILEQADNITYASQLPSQDTRRSERSTRRVTLHQTAPYSPLRTSAADVAVDVDAAVDEVAKADAELGKAKRQKNQNVSSVKRKGISPTNA